MRGDKTSPLDPSAGGRGIFYKHTLINVKPPPQVLANHPRALIVCLLILLSQSHAIVDDKDSNSTAPLQHDPQCLGDPRKKFYLASSSLL